MAELIFAQRWYHYLHSKEDQRGKALFDKISKEAARDSLIVCQDIQSRLFTSFANHVEFAKHQARYKYECRCFFEVCLDEQRQKPRFDIEANFKEYPQSQEFDWNHVIDSIIDAILRVFQDRKIDLSLERDILVMENTRRASIS